MNSQHKFISILGYYDWSYTICTLWSYAMRNYVHGNHITLQVEFKNYYNMIMLQLLPQ
jgi:hypothetical protein